MSGVERWEPENTALGYNMRPGDGGSFVLASEYDRLEQESKRLRSLFNSGGLLAEKESVVVAERDTLRGQVATLQSNANSWQSGYDKGRHDGTKHRQDEVKQMSAQVEAMRAALEKISAYAPLSGIKDPGLTKMHMGILARDAIDPALQAKPAA